MKRSIVAALLGASLLLAPAAFAQTTVPIGDPVSDTLNLWSEVASALNSIANDFAVLFSGNNIAINYRGSSAQQEPQSQTAAAVVPTEVPQQPAPPTTYTVRSGDTLGGIAQTYGIPLASLLAANDLSQAALLHVGETLTIPSQQTAPVSNFDQTTNPQNIKSAQLTAAQSNLTEATPTTGTPVFNPSNYVTQSELANALRALYNSTSQDWYSAAATPPLGGGPPNTIAAASAINQLSGVTITNANLTASEIPNLSGSYLSLNGGAITGTTTINTALGIGTTSPATPLSVLGEVGVTDDQPTSTSTLGTERVSDGGFTSDPTSSWTLGSGWTWDSTNDRASYAGSGGPIGSISIDDGGSGYTTGDTITISGGSGDATYTATVSSGKVTSLTQVSAGTSYTTGTGISTSGGTGSGLKVSIVQISDSSNTLSQTITTSPSDPITSYTLPRASGDITWTGTPFRVAFTIQNYSGSGSIKVTLGQISSYYKTNGTYVLMLISTSSSLTFTPTSDFSGAITNVSAKPISPLAPAATINNGDGTPALEIRPGGSSDYNTFVGLGSGANYTSGSIMDEGFNSAFGYDAFYSNTSGSNDTALGFYSLFSNTNGFNNVGVGSDALTSNTTGNSNTGLGFYALQSETIGAHNTAVGSEALYLATSPSFNTAIGDTSLWSDTTGGNNTAVGYASLFGNKTGNSNVAMGYQPLFSNTTGSQNVAVGYLALTSNTTGANNVGMGFRALQSNRTGTQNAAVGTQALQNATTSSNNTAFGYLALQGGTTGSLTISGTDNTAVGLQALESYIDGGNNTAIGMNAMANASTTRNSAAVGFAAGKGASNNDAYQGLAALGYQSGLSLQNGSDYNTLLGYQSGTDITIGADNIIIGSEVNSGGSHLTTGTNNILIGFNAVPTSTSATNFLNIGGVLFGSLPATSSATSFTVSAIGKIGIGTSTPYSRLTVWGTDSASTSAFLVANSASTTVFSVFDNGNSTYSGSIFQSSDQRLKSNVQTLDASASLSAIEQLNPVSYFRIDQPATGENLGFIAQQVQPIFPDLVSTTSPTSLTPDGTLTLNYEGLISPIVAAIQEITNIGGTFEQNIIAWLGNAQNGIVDLFAQNGHFANELCVGSTCVTPAQFQAMVAAAGQPSSGQGGDSASDNIATTSSDAPAIPPVIQINGNNPAIIAAGAIYNDLGATITGPQADLNLGIDTFVNGAQLSPVQIDTSQAATDTIDYVVTDQNGLPSTTTRTVIIEAPSIAPPDAPSDNASTTAASLQ